MWQTAALKVTVPVLSDHSVLSFVFSVRTQTCQWEDFVPECPPNSFLLIKSAFYGRLHSGRCSRREFGFLGCGSDVTPIIHRTCSGRSRCVFAVTSLHGNHGCPIDLTAYLDAEYVCQAGAYDETRKLVITVCKFLQDFCRFLVNSALPCDQLRCGDPTSVTTQTAARGSDAESSESGYISSAVASASHCGSQQCPYTIRVARGQRINVTLHDFTLTSTARDVTSTSAGGREQTSGSTCQWYFTVREGSSRKDVSRCWGRVTSEGDDRVEHVYESRSNELQIELNPQQQQQQPQQQPQQHLQQPVMPAPTFLIHYKGKTHTTSECQLM